MITMVYVAWCINRLVLLLFAFIHCELKREIFQLTTKTNFEKKRKMKSVLRTVLIALMVVCIYMTFAEGIVYENGVDE